MVVGEILDDEELLHISIKGLPKDFNVFRSKIHTKSTQLSFDELTTMLNAKEESMNNRGRGNNKRGGKCSTSQSPSFNPFSHYS